jgi:bleomycin hydrolase
MSSQSIGPEQLGSFQHAFERDPQARLARNAVTKNPVHAVALDRGVVARTNHTFSHMLKSNAATAQNLSGRCWLFAGLNLFRVEAMQRLNLDQFELSQTYLMFWDKL